MAEGRHEEGVDLLRNALAALPLCEGEPDSSNELNILSGLIRALFITDTIDELEPFVARFREAAKAQSHTDGQVSWCDYLIASARLHEVLPYPIANLFRPVPALSSLVQPVHLHPV